MTDDQKEQIRARILERLSELEQSIAGLEELVKPISPDRALGRVTRAEAQVTQNLHIDNLDKAKHRQQTLKSVLDSIDEESFGKCVWCNSPIDFDRLLALPEGTKCIRCA